MSAASRSSNLQVLVPDDHFLSLDPHIVVCQKVQGYAWPISFWVGRSMELRLKFRTMSEWIAVPRSLANVRMYSSRSVRLRDYLHGRSESKYLQVSKTE